LVERADEIGAGIGQRESFAPAQVIERMARIALRVIGAQRNESHVVELARRLEKHPVAMLLASLRRPRGPPRVARREFQLSGVGGLVLLPFGDALGERELGEWGA